MLGSFRNMSQTVKNLVKLGIRYLQQNMCIFSYVIQSTAAHQSFCWRSQRILTSLSMEPEKNNNKQ